MRLRFKQDRPRDARNAKKAERKRSFSPVLEIPILEVPIMEIIRDDKERREKVEIEKIIRRDQERKWIDIPEREMPDMDPRWIPPPEPAQEPQRGVVIIEL